MSKDALIHREGLKGYVMYNYRHTCWNKCDLFNCFNMFLDTHTELLLYLEMCANIAFIFSAKCILDTL